MLISCKLLVFLIRRKIIFCKNPFFGHPRENPDIARNYRYFTGIQYKFPLKLPLKWLFPKSNFQSIFWPKIFFDAFQHISNNFKQINTQNLTNHSVKITLRELVFEMIFGFFFWILDFEFNFECIRLPSTSCSLLYFWLGNEQVVALNRRFEELGLVRQVELDIGFIELLTVLISPNSKVSFGWSIFDSVNSWIMAVEEFSSMIWKAGARGDWSWSNSVASCINFKWSISRFIASLTYDHVLLKTVPKLNFVFFFSISLKN